MEDIILCNEGIGVLKFVCLILAGATLGAYSLLRFGFVAAVVALLGVSYGWLKFVGGDAPPNAVFAFWYIMNWVCTLAFIGLLRVSAM
ncbi:unnamed protein product, partial [marine sediment metagenome]